MDQSITAIEPTWFLEPLEDLYYMHEMALVEGFCEGTSMM